LTSKKTNKAPDTVQRR